MEPEHGGQRVTVSSVLHGEVPALNTALEALTLGLTDGVNHLTVFEHRA